jgi:hypothetical protein
MKHAAVAAGVSRASMRRYFSHRGRDKVQNALRALTETPEADVGISFAQAGIGIVASNLG